jgi:hypothetical protein
VFPPRPIGILLGLQGSQNPFSGAPSYKAIAHLPLADRVAAMRDPAVRARILSEDRVTGSTFPLITRLSFSACSPSATRQTTRRRAKARSRRRRRAKGVAGEVAYDMLLADEGRSFIFAPLTNYGDLHPRRERRAAAHPNTIVGLSDGGAHVGFISDGSFPTFLLPTGAATGARDGALAGAGAAADLRHGAGRRASRPRRAGARHEGGHQRHRLRRPRAGAARDGVGPARRRAAPAARARGLRRDRGERDGDLPRRPSHRRPARPLVRNAARTAGCARPRGPHPGRPFVGSARRSSRAACHDRPRWLASFLAFGGCAGEAGLRTASTGPVVPGFTADTATRAGLASGAKASEAAAARCRTGCGCGRAMVGGVSACATRPAGAVRGGGAGPRRLAVLHIPGDASGGAYRFAGGAPQVEGAGEGYEVPAASRRAAAEALSEAGGRPVFLIGRPGMHGSSGDHARDRHTGAEVELVDAALDRAAPALRRAGFRALGASPRAAPSPPTCWRGGGRRCAR